MLLLLLALFAGYDTEMLSVGIKQVEVYMADTPEKIIQGLSNQECLPENQGMLFVFKSPGKYGVWMKEMLFPIDVIWLDKKGGVIDLKQNISPKTYPFLFKPSKPAWYILEVNAGWVKENRIEIGSKFRLGT